MRLPRSSSDISGRFVADASVIINLNATGCGRDIIRASGITLYISEIAMDEIQRDHKSGRDDAKLTSLLINSGMLEILALDEAAQQIFEGLVSGRAEDTLDDGEAATLATAVASGGHALIDERKALRLAESRFPTLNTLTTSDLLAAHTVESTLGRNRLIDALFNALQGARMRVADHRLGWVVDLLGPDRTRLCRSLPANLRA